MYCLDQSKQSAKLTYMYIHGAVYSHVNINLMNICIKVSVLQPREGGGGGGQSLWGDGVEGGDGGKLTPYY